LPAGIEVAKVTAMQMPPPPSPRPYVREWWTFSGSPGVPPPLPRSRKASPARPSVWKQIGKHAALVGIVTLLIVALLAVLLFGAGVVGAAVAVFLFTAPAWAIALAVLWLLFR
jgi:hypothetical protein